MSWFLLLMAHLFAVVWGIIVAYGLDAGRPA